MIKSIFGTLAHTLHEANFLYIISLFHSTHEHILFIHVLYFYTVCDRTQNACRWRRILTRACMGQSNKKNNKRNTFARSQRTYGARKINIFFCDSATVTSQGTLCWVRVIRICLLTSTLLTKALIASSHK